MSSCAVRTPLVLSFWRVACYMYARHGSILTGFDQPLELQWGDPSSGKTSRFMVGLSLQ